MVFAIKEKNITKKVMSKDSYIKSKKISIKEERLSVKINLV